MVKKKSKMIIVSLSKGIELRSADMSTFKPLTDEIVLRGLMTRNTLRLERSTADSSYLAPTSAATVSVPVFYNSVVKVIYPEMTITKSRIFQEFFK